ncbi:MAG: dTDP-4-dehydrorhamnose reductase [Epsilonproteobacteria bacterium]|nr:dTDP-4-dehydrorhamnose reductase [Campylobacterota bacterium]
MHKNDQVYDQWNEQKKQIAKNETCIKFQQFHIIFMKMGVNIGFEQDGKGEECLRPVLVYKKFNHRVFLGIPLTSKPKFDRFHFEFEYKRGKKSYAILSQIKLFDIKRAKYYDGKISKKQFEKLQEKLLELIVTPLPKKGECTEAICTNIITKKLNNCNILVTGSNGQLGSELKELSSKYPANYFFTDRNDLDITCKDSLADYIQKNDIDTIINCAAYTAVDKAETDKENANKANHLAVKYIAEIAKEKTIKLIHVSTDYVFDGTNCEPYTENGTTNPQGVYGQTKLDGEMALQEINPKNSIIIRTSWVYSSYGANFVKTMLKLGKERGQLGVIFDQVGSPTYAKDLAQTILEILPQIDNENVAIYHYSNEGVLSWYDFAKEIMRMAKLECTLNPIETKEYPTPAKRPHYSLLNKTKIKNRYNIKIPYWKDSLDECLKRLGERK